MFDPDRAPNSHVETPWGVVRPRSKLWSWVPEADNLLRMNGDPGSRAWRIGAICAAIVFVPLVMFLQQFTLGLRNQQLSTAPAHVKASERVDDPGVSELIVRSKIAVKSSQLARADLKQEAQRRAAEERRARDAAERARPKPGAARRRGRQGSRNDPQPPGIRATREPDAEEIAQEQESLEEQTTAEIDEELAALDQMAVTRTDRLRVVAVAGELSGKAAAALRLDALDKELEPQSALRADLTWFQWIYGKGAASVPPDIRQQLIDRHGWFGSLAVSFEVDDSDPTRWAAISGGENLGRFVVFLGLFVILAALASIIAALVVLTRTLRGELSAAYEGLAPGDDPGSIYIETFALFGASFSFLLLIGLMLFGAGVEGTFGALALQEVMMWLLILVPLWPIARGVQWRRVLEDLGWTRGHGVIKEIGCGALGYLVGIVMTVIGIFVGRAVDAVTGTSEAAPAPGGYPMFDAPPGNSWFLVLLGVAGATIWAPIVEETVFRGALYRFCRAYMRPIWSVLITSALFGLYHPYAPGGLASVALAGLVFGYLREWRGSLIAPVVAHALHNATISMFSVGLIAAAG